MLKTISPSTKKELILFAIAWEFGIKCGVNYCHAPNAQVARAGFIGSRAAGYRIVAIGPALGAFATDNHGDNCIL